jgi:signal transduction histidine kinase/DNA-binding response OmpR family regulator
LDTIVRPNNQTRLREELAVGRDWLWEAGPDLRYLWISDGLEIATGYAPEKLVGRSGIRHLASIVADSEECARFQAKLDNIQGFRDVICRIEAPGTGDRWISVSGEPRFDKSRAFLGYSGHGREITHLVSSNGQASASPESSLADDLQLALDAVEMGIVVLDKDLITEVVNHGFYDVWKVAPDDVRVGEPYRAFIDVTRRMGVQEIQQGEWDAHVERILSEIRADTAGPRELALSDGRTVIFNVKPLSGDRRLVTYFDVTEQARRETEARQARERLEFVIESMPANVVIYDAEDRFLLANSRVKQRLPWLVPALTPGTPVRDGITLTRAQGYFRNTGDPALDALYDDQPEAWIDAFTVKYMQAPKAHERKEADGHWSQVIDTRAPDGTFIGIRVDITELKKREHQLKEAERRAVLADRAKSEFLANMSHEIRTPMNGVLGMAELLSRTELDCKQRTFADIIVKSGNALLTIINDVLDFSKIDAGQMELDPAPFDLPEAVEDVATLLSTKAKEKDLELIVRIDPALPHRFVGDVGRIRQIVTNLVGNAVKFTDTGHVLIDVSGALASNAYDLKIVVTDTGIGIAADKLGLVFDQFSQVDGSSTRRHEGTGLGLAITSRLVKLMGGAVDVESEPGRGSKFTIRLALPPAPGDAASPQTPLTIAGARVLVVDDNAINRTILMEQMESWKFNACAAVDGGEALKVLAAIQDIGSRVDCAVLDFQMPGMSGLELAERIRANSYFDQMSIILLSSVDEPVSRYRGVDIDAHLIKPTRSSVLFEAIVSNIGKRNLATDTVPPESVADVVKRPEHRLTVVTGGQAAHTTNNDPVDILVAEDNEVNQLVFRQILGETSLRFVIVEDGEKALEAYQSLNPRLILMDVSMPRMNGLQATDAIRKLEAENGIRVPIVGVTAHALKGDHERCMEAGMDDYLPKPISPNALLAKIDSWMASDARAGKAG